MFVEYIVDATKIQPLFHQLFEEIATNKETQDFKALQIGGYSTTYAEVNQRANALACYLTENKRISLGDRVAILLDKSFDLIISMLAIFKVGAVFVLLDNPKHTESENRFRHCISSCSPALIITHESFLPYLAGAAVNVIFLSRELYASAFGRSDAYKIAKLDQHAECYITFTSGSTGKPKGIITTHEGIYARIAAHNNALRINEGRQTVIAQFCPLSVDASLMEIFLALATGACLDLIPIEAQQNLFQLSDYFTKNKIEVAIFTPTVLKQLNPKEFTTLRAIITTGEAVTHEVLDPWKQIPIIINGYGPAEFTICSTLSRCSPGKKISIGKAIPGTKIAIRNPRTFAEISEVETDGEICLSGLGIAKAYIDAKDSYQNRFIVTDNEGVVYKTGDFGYVDSAGDFFYKGRIDRQIKKYGRLICPEEIETTLKSHAEVSSVAIHIQDRSKLIIATVKLTSFIPEHLIEQKIYELAKFSRVHLPMHMLPGRWAISTPEKTEIWKATTSDTLTLFHLAHTTPCLSKILTPLQEEYYNKIKTIWSEVLFSVEELSSYSIGLDDDFFLLGGDSLLYKIMITRFEEMFSPIIFPLKEFEKRSSIALLMNHLIIKHEKITFLPTSLVEQEMVASNQYLFMVHALLGNAVNDNKEMATMLASEFAASGKPRFIYGLSDPTLNTPLLYMSMQEKAYYYVSGITKIQMSGPYYLLGWSFGGALIDAMANLLRAAKEEVITFRVDSTAPNFLQRGITPENHLCYSNTLARFAWNYISPRTAVPALVVSPAASTDFNFGTRTPDEQAAAPAGAGVLRKLNGLEAGTTCPRIDSDFITLNESVNRDDYINQITQIFLKVQMEIGRHDKRDFIVSHPSHTLEVAKNNALATLTYSNSLLTLHDYLFVANCKTVGGIDEKLGWSFQDESSNNCIPILGNHTEIMRKNSEGFLHIIDVVKNIIGQSYHESAFEALHKNLKTLYLQHVSLPQVIQNNSRFPDFISRDMAPVDLESIELELSNKGKPVSFLNIFHEDGSRGVQCFVISMFGTSLFSHQLAYFWAIEKKLSQFNYVFLLDMSDEDAIDIKSLLFKKMPEQRILLEKFIQQFEKVKQKTLFILNDVNILVVDDFFKNIKNVVITTRHAQTLKGFLPFTEFVDNIKAKKKANNLFIARDMDKKDLETIFTIGEIEASRLESKPLVLKKPKDDGQTLFSIIESFFENEEQSTLCLTGDAGIGKTYTAKFLVHYFLEKFFTGGMQYIPLYFSLSNDVSLFFKKFSRLFKGHELLQKLSFLIILDEYNYDRGKVNVYEQYSVSQLNAKLIIFFRSNCFHFYFGAHFLFKTAQFVKYDLKLNDANHFFSNETLQNLESRNIHTMFLRAGMASILNTFSEQEGINISKAKNYHVIDFVVRSYIKHESSEIKKIVGIDHDKIVNLLMKTFAHLAFSFFIKNNFNSDQIDYLSLHRIVTFGLDVAGDLEAPIYQAIIKCSGLFRVEENQLVFFDNIAFSYFVSNFFIYGAQKKFDTEISFFSDDVSVILEKVKSTPQVFDFIVAQLRSSQDLITLLLNIINLSKIDSSADAVRKATLSISLLNYARINFSGMNFEKIKICGADLSSAICHKTNFTNADLPKVNFSNAFCSEANFSRSNVLDSITGENIFFDLNADVRKVVLIESSEISLVASRNKILFINFGVGKIVRETICSQKYYITDFIYVAEKSKIYAVDVKGIFYVISYEAGAVELASVIGEPVLSIGYMDNKIFIGCYSFLVKCYTTEGTFISDIRTTVSFISSLLTLKNRNELLISSGDKLEKLVLLDAAPFAQSICTSIGIHKLWELGDGLMYVTASLSGVLSFFRSDCEKEFVKITLPYKEITAVCISDDQKKVFVAGNMGAILECNLSNGVIINTYSFLERKITGLFYKATDKAIWAINEVGIAKSWRIQSAIFPDLSMPGEKFSTLATAISKNDLIIGTCGGSILFWNFEHYQLIRTIQTEAASITSLFYYEKTNEIYFGDLNGNVFLTNYDCAPIQKIIKLDNSIVSLVFREKDQLLFVQDHVENIFDVTKSGEVRRYLTNNFVLPLLTKQEINVRFLMNEYGIVFPEAVNCQFLLGRKKIQCVDENTGMKHYSYVGDYCGLSLSQDGASIISASRNILIEWDTVTGKTKQLYLSDNAISCVNNKHPTLVAAGCNDQTICLWNRVDATILQIMKVGNDKIKSIFFVSNERILSVLENQMIIVWKYSNKGWLVEWTSMAVFSAGDSLIQDVVSNDNQLINWKRYGATLFAASQQSNLLTIKRDNFDFQPCVQNAQALLTENELCVERKRVSNYAAGARAANASATPLFIEVVKKWV